MSSRPPSRCVQEQKALLSFPDNIASLWRKTYSGLGIRPTVKSVQDALSIPTASWSFLPIFSVQELKFMMPRAFSTSRTIIHDTGATWLYHGQRVSFEWQFQQERRRIVSISGGISNWLLMALSAGA